MDHDDGGLARLLTNPHAYEAFQSLVGADGWRRRLVDAHLRLPAGARVLDIGCGPGTMLRFLPAGVRYVGFDMNPRYIEYARSRHAGRGEFYAARVSAAQIAADGFDVVMAHAILHHLGDAEAAALVDIAWHQLKPGGFLLTSDNAWVPGQSRAARFIIGRDRGRHVRTPEAYCALVRARFDRLETAIFHDGYRIPYTLFTIKAWKADAPMPAG